MVLGVGDLALDLPALRERRRRDARQAESQDADRDAAGGWWCPSWSPPLVGRILASLPTLFRRAVYTGDVGDEVLADRTAAGGPRVDGAPGRDGASRGSPAFGPRRVARVERADLRRRGIAEQDRRAARGQARCTARCSRSCCVGVEAARRVRREPRRAAQRRVRRIEIDEIVLAGAGRAPRRSALTSMRHARAARARRSRRAGWPRRRCCGLP